MIVVRIVVPLSNQLEIVVQTLPEIALLESESDMIIYEAQNIIRSFF